MEPVEPHPFLAGWSDAEQQDVRSQLASYAADRVNRLRIRLTELEGQAADEMNEIYGRYGPKPQPAVMQAQHQAIVTDLLGPEPDRSLLADLCRQGEALWAGDAKLLFNDLYAWCGMIYGFLPRPTQSPNAEARAYWASVPVGGLQPLGQQVNRLHDLLQQSWQGDDRVHPEVRDCLMRTVGLLRPFKDRLLLAQMWSTMGLKLADMVREYPETPLPRRSTGIPRALYDWLDGLADALPADLQIAQDSCEARCQAWAAEAAQKRK